MRSSPPKYPFLTTAHPSLAPSLPCCPQDEHDEDMGGEDIYAADDFEDDEARAAARRRSQLPSSLAPSRSLGSLPPSLNPFAPCLPSSLPP